MASVLDSSSGVDSQWLFPIECLSQTPTALDRSIHDEMYDRARGIEFLFRLGSSIGLHLPGIMTAATWFHRFFMRYSMEDHHRQNVAAACIFLATKTEECGRKLKDVARVMVSKLKGIDPGHVPDNGKDVEEAVTWILQTEEVLLDALCFDFVVNSPHGDLVTLFETFDVSPIIQDYAYSIAHDSFRTPLCVLYPPKIIAAACFVLAQRVADGPHSLSLDARISSSAPSASLPTPPSHKPTSPDASRFAIDFFRFDNAELGAVADIILEFYNFQASTPLGEHLGRLVEVPRPTGIPQRFKLYKPFNEPNDPPAPPNGPAPLPPGNATPDSLQGSRTPIKPENTSGWLPVRGEIQSEETKTAPRLDLS